MCSSKMKFVGMCIVTTRIVVDLSCCFLPHFDRNSLQLRDFIKFQFVAPNKRVCHDNRGKY